jgi:hypothetical protein
VPVPLQVSTVHPAPSEQSTSLQQTLHAAPQSLGVLGAHAHTPPVQVAPALLQGVPQAPQLSALVERSVSQPAAAEQSPKPVSHAGAPASQCWFGPTAWLQAPQLSLSVSVLTHAEPQRVSEPAQPATQLVPSQSAVIPEQTTPHAPQL